VSKHTRDACIGVAAIAASLICLFNGHPSAAMCFGLLALVIA
jgi:hypothetical protein